MASNSSGISRRMALAIATAVTGLVLAGGVSVVSLVGWIGPAQPATDTVQASATEQASLSATQVVLVPIAPVTTSAQQPPTGVSLARAETTTRPSTAEGAFGASRHTENGRPEGSRVRHGERDDD